MDSFKILQSKVITILAVYLIGWGTFHSIKFAFGNPVVVVHPGNSNPSIFPDRPWRIWSGNPCRPCSITARRGNRVYPISSCQSACGLSRNLRCVQVGEFGFKCVCRTDHVADGKFCEKLIVRRDFMLVHQYRRFRREWNQTIIPIGNESDFYYECKYNPSGAIVHYQLRHARELIKIADPENEVFECPPELKLQDFDARCQTKDPTNNTKCVSCYDWTPSMERFNFTDERSFWDLFKEPYGNKSDCQNIQESYAIMDFATPPRRNRITLPIRDSSSCAGRPNSNPIERTFRAGCRQDPRTDECFENLHFGQRCKSCEQGVWGDKCQYVDECEWNGCKETKWLADGPCGKGGTCISRPNGKFCVCPEGKLDGFVSVYEDRVKDPICSPAGNLTNANPLDLLASSNYPDYTFLLDASPFHTYYGCQIDDPCYISPSCNNGTKQIVGLVDEETVGFKVHSRISNMLNFRFYALEVNKNKLQCKCNCYGGFSGTYCEDRDPCYFNPNYCFNGGACRKIDNELMACNCVPPYEGDRCNIINLCKAVDVCDSGVSDCYPCLHRGKCNEDKNVIPYTYSCDCSSTGFVGEKCQCPEGEVELRPVSDSNDAIIAEESSFEVIVRRKGGKPFIVVDMGDGHHFSIQEHLLEKHVYYGKDAYYYEFKHQYSVVGKFNATVYITNCDPSPKHKPTDIDRTYLSNTASLEITTQYPLEFLCLPMISLKNVAHNVDDAPDRLRQDQFTVEVELKSECDTLYHFEHHWSLHKLDESFPNEVPENNVPIEKVVSTPADAHKKHLKFSGYKLVEGNYLIKYTASVIKAGIPPKNSITKGYFTILLSSPEIIIRGDSGDTASVDISKDVVLDASDTYDPSYPELSPQINFEYKCAAPQPCGLGPWSGSAKITIPAGTLRLGTTYKIHLDVSSTHKGETRKAMKVLTLTAAASSLQIECVENCERNNPGDEILVHCWCRSCETQPKLTFTWEPPSDAVVFVPKENTSLSGVVIPEISSANSSMPRKVVCTSAATGLLAKLKVSVNQPPIEGDCKINPHTGIYLSTTFDILCTGYLDPDEPLEYSFYAGVDGDVGKDLNNLYLLAHDINPDAEGIYLPYNPGGGDTTVLIKVTDRLGLSVAKKLTVLVTRPDATDYPDLLEKLVYGNNSIMKRRWDYGDDQGALQVQLAVLHGLLDNQFIGLSPDQFKRLRGSITDILSEVQLSSFKEVEQTIHSLYLFKQWETEDNVEAVQNITVTLVDCASKLAELVIGNSEIIPTELVNILARAATASLGRLMKETNDKGTELLRSLPVQSRNERQLTDYDLEDEVGRDYFFDVHELEDEFDAEGNREVEDGLSDSIQSYAKMSHHAFSAMEHLLDAVGERLEDGKSFTATREDVAIHVESYRELPSANSSIDIQTGSGKGVRLSILSGLKDVLKSQDVSHIEIQVAEVLGNPFFDDSSAIPGTPVLSVVVKDRSKGGERLPLVLDEVEHPFEFWLPLESTAKNVLQLSKVKRLTTFKPLNVITDRDIQPFHLILPYNSRVEISVEDYPVDTEFIVVVQKDFWMVKEDFCDEKKTIVLNGVNGYTTTFNTESGANENPDERFLEYYVGVFPYKPGTFNVKMEYSIYFTRSSCLFRDEDRKFWSEEGCVVADDTTANMLHCLCRHASIFAGTQFAISNDLPTINIFDFDPDEFERCNILLKTECVCLTLYVIGMIICWLLDRRDKRKLVGITIMADLGDKLERSYYLITVFTGSGFGAGTTADVSLQIYGSNGRSQVYTLKEKSTRVLNRGGLDAFLVSAKEDLGKLEKIRIWHDNAGSCPAWFCRKIIIKNVKSSMEWYFFVYRWMHISGTESTVILEQNVATEEEHMRFGRRFRENFADQFDNAHLWLSLFRRPAASRFTRCQRLSCAFAILTSYMLLNILFCEIELNDENDIFGEQTVLCALHVPLYALPFGFLLVFVFRRIRQRYLPTLIIWRNSIKSQEIEQQMKDVGVIVPQHQSVRDPSLSDVSHDFSIPSTDIEDLESWLASDIQHGYGDADESSGRYPQFTRCVQEEHSSEMDRIALGRIGLVHAVRAENPNTFVFAGDHDINEIEDLIEEEIKAYLLKSSTEDNIDSVQQKIYDEQVAGFDINLNQPDIEQKVNLSPFAFETCEMHPVAEACCYLPWWFIYIAWILCFGLILVCLYFTLLYGLQYGCPRSINWLFGIICSLIFSLFIMQPLQILIAALLLTILCRLDHWSIIQEERFQILLKNEDDLGHRRPMTFRVFHPERKHPPLSGHQIFGLKVEAREREKLSNSVLKLTLYGIILIPLVILAYSGHGGGCNFHLVQNLRSLLKLQDVQDSVYEINSESKLFDYLEHTFIPAIHPEVLYNGVRVVPGKFDPVYLDDGQNLLLGVPRIRQVRVRAESCNIPETVSKAFSHCYGDYKASTQDTQSYNPLWKPFGNVVSPKAQDIWRFRNESDPEFVVSITQKGQMGSYPGTGYTVELGRRWRESLSVVRYLKRSRWIDHRSRGIFIEFSILNPNVNLYADIVIMIERGPTQAFQISHQINPLVLSSPDDIEITPWLRVSYGMLIVCCILLVFIFFWNLFAKRILGIYHKPWFWLDLVVICGIVISLGIALKKNFVVEESLDKIEDMKFDEYVNLQLVAYWSEIEKAAFSICMFVCLLKIWRILTLIDMRFLIPSLTIKVSFRFLIAYFLVLGIILVAFACAGHFIFGHELEKFHTFGQSMISLIDQIASVNLFMELGATHSFLGPVYSFVFGFVVIFLTMNLLVSLLNQGYNEGKNIANERSRNIFSCSKVKASTDTSHIPLLQLQPHRLEGMKTLTAEFFRERLKLSESSALSNIKNYASNILKGTGYRIVTRIPRKHQEELMKESHINQMRVATIEFLKQRMGTEMRSDEFENYSDYNRMVLVLRIRKLEQKTHELNKKLELLGRLMYLEDY